MAAFKIAFGIVFGCGFGLVAVCFSALIILWLIDKSG